VHRKHEITNKESRRLCKRETRLDMELTGAKSRHGRELSSAWILAAICGSVKATTCARIGIGGLSRVGAAI